MLPHGQLSAVKPGNHTQLTTDIALVKSWRWSLNPLESFQSLSFLTFTNLKILMLLATPFLLTQAFPLAFIKLHFSDFFPPNLSGYFFEVSFPLYPPLTVGAVPQGSALRAFLFSLQMFFLSHSQSFDHSPYADGSHS